MFRLPAEDGANAIRSGNDCHRIAFTPCGIFDRQRRAIYPLDRRDDVEHRIARAITAVEDAAFAPFAQMCKPIDMRRNQVADVNIVAQARAVRRVVIGTENLKMAFLAERCLAGGLDQMRGRGLGWGLGIGAA